MDFSLKSSPNQTVHLIACLAFNFAQSLFNFLLSGTCHQCSDVLCLYKCHVPQLPAVAWPQKCHLGKNRLFSLTFSSLEGLGSQGHTVNLSVISLQIMRVLCNYSAFSDKMKGGTPTDRKLPWPMWPFAMSRKKESAILWCVSDERHPRPDWFKNLRKSIWIKPMSINYHAIIKF